MIPRVLKFWLSLVLLLVYVGTYTAQADYGETELYSIDDYTLSINEGVQVLGHPPYDEGWKNQFGEDVSVPNIRFDRMYQELKKVNFPSTLRELGSESFIGYDFSVLEFPEGFTWLHDYSLYACTIIRIKLPSTFESREAFPQQDAYIHWIEVSGNHPYLKAEDGVLYSRDGKILYYYPNQKNNVHFDVPKSVTHIADYAFYGNHYLQSISLPLGLEVIGDGAFADCGRLTSIALPLTVEAIGNFAFSNCVSLQRVSPSPGLALLTTVFDNCPLLLGVSVWQGDQGATDEVSAANYPDELFRIRRPHGGCFMASSKGMEYLPVYDAQGMEVAKIPSGTPVWMGKEKDGLAQIKYAMWPAEGITGSDYDDRLFWHEAYARAEDLAFTARDDLFYISGIIPKSPGVPVFREPFVNSHQAESQMISQLNSKDFRLSWYSFNDTILGKWVKFHWPSIELEDGDLYSNETTAFAYARDFAYTRPYTGDKNIYCIIIASNHTGEPLLDSEANQRALSFIFNGTQAQVLHQGDEYTCILVNRQIGYVRNDSVFIVDQEQP